jgi:hypothetical protein
MWHYSTHPQHKKFIIVPTAIVSMKFFYWPHQKNDGGIKKVFSLSL